MSTATAVSAAVVAGAVLYPGFATADVDLNDGGVWVTNKNLGLVGHLNFQSKLLDGGYTANSDGFDVAQDASTVFNLNTDLSSVSPVDVANVLRGTDVQLPGAAELALGGRTIALTDKVSGSVWITTASALSGFSDKDQDPIAAAPGAVAAVSASNVVAVANPRDRTVSTFAVASDGTVQEPEIVPVEAMEGFGDMQIAVLGDDPVVFDSESGQLVLPGGKTVTLDGTSGARLQQSGPAADSVAIATSTALIQQPLNGTAPVITDVGEAGPPSAPVQQDGCVHAAWAGAGSYVRVCANPADDLRTDVPGIGGSAELVFRVNRSVVVLNDTNAGDVWLVQQNLELVDNWGDIIPPTQESEEEDDESAADNPVNTLPDRSGENRPPVASDDSLGARAGRTTILNVLDNDTDPDGDLLTATIDGAQPSVGTVQSIHNGAALQIVLPEDAPAGRITFSYTVADGRGGTDTASVSVGIRGVEANDPPKAKRPTTILVEEGRSVSQNVLSTWMDPDGDDLFLVSAEPTADGDQVRTRSDGLLTFRDVGKGQGMKDVSIVVSDGRDTVEGTISFDVRPRGILPPVATFDHVTAVVGQVAQFSPLQNDFDPAGGQLSLAKASTEAKGEVVPNYETGTVAFTPPSPGTYYVQYLVTNGPQSATGLVRIDAKAEGMEGSPIAVRDVALLPANGDVLVDVLANDTDPVGGVLVVQSVQTADGSPLDVAVLDHNVLRIHDVRGLEQQATVSYTVSNGTASAEGEVSVLSVPGPRTLLPPQANADTAVVRVGDVVNIPVLENDTHPNDDELTVQPVLAQAVDPADGRAFVSENMLRFVAGDVAKTVYAIYEVTDSTGQTDSAEVRITIRGRDDEKNTPPVPKNIEARVIAGSTLRIPVPLDGIDADGDSVFLAGIASAPAAGAAIPGTNYIDYTASATGAGTDTFTYRVRDRLGLESSGTIQVGIAPAAETNQKPVAVDDTVLLRPGRAISVDVLRNDSDPDGDPLGFDPEGLSAAPEDMRPEIRDGRVHLRAPGSDGSFNARYRVTDNRGGAANGNISVNVDQNAPLLLPIARDDRVEPVDTKGRTAVDVPVLENDEDPDGVAAELTVAVESRFEGVSVTAGNTVRVELTDQTQLIPYTVEDIDGGVARAVIWVPSLSQQYPTLVSSAPLEVTAGAALDLDLAELVDVRDGRSPRVTVAKNVKALGSSNTGRWVTDPQTLRFEADSDYAGMGSMTFEVTDGTGPDDPEGLAATLTVLIDVIPPPETNLPPTLTAGSLETAVLEPAATLDLRELADDPNPEDVPELAFALEGEVPAGFDASLEGSVLSVAAGAGVDAGTVAELGISVTDGEEKTLNKVTVTALASNRPLPVATDDVVAQAVQGEAVSVPVLDNDVNPYPETPLRITDVVTDGNGTAVQDGASVVVTPAGDFVGRMSVKYTVMDKTGEPNRTATARINLTVEGRPGTPSTPIVESTRNKSVVLSWDPPASNGSAITSYTVTGSNGFLQECPTTTCTLTGLTNNVDYVFRVAATNAIGTSDPSAESAVARPDTQPAQPAPPTLAFGDQQLTVSFTPPANEGSPIESYDLQISPAPPSGAVQRSAAGSPVVWEGLENGTAYKVRVQARNAAPEPSEWSDYSVAETPAGLPGTPQAPTTARAESVGTESQLVVDWNDVASNGAPVTRYQVQEFRGGALTRTLPEVAVSNQTITVPNSEAEYSYSVRAYNKAGWSPYGAQSSPRRAVGAPSAPEPPSLVEAMTGGAGRAVTITYNSLTAAQRNGARESEVSYQASFNGSGWRSIQSGETVGGFTNGSDVSARIRAVVNSDGASYASSASGASNTVRPYGSPGSASTGGTDGAPETRQATVTWSPPNTASHDVARLQIRIDGGGWENVAIAKGSRKVGNGYDQVHTIEARSVNSRGTAGPISKTTVRTGSAPPPRPTSMKGVVNVNSCLEYAKGSDHWNDPTCTSYMLPQGTNVEVTCKRTTWGTRAWLYMTRDYRGYQFIRSDTVTRQSGLLVSALPECPASY